MLRINTNYKIGGKLQPKILVSRQSLHTLGLIPDHSSNMIVRWKVPANGPIFTLCKLPVSASATASKRQRTGVVLNLFQRIAENQVGRNTTMFNEIDKIACRPNTDNFIHPVEN